MIDVTADRRLSLSAGAGLGQFGPQYAGGLRVRPVMGDGGAFGLAAGLSAGRYWCCPDVVSPHDDSQGVETKAIPTAYLWGNLDGGYEFRWRFGMLLRIYNGASIRLNRPGRTCSRVTVGSTSSYIACDDAHPPPRWLPYMGFAMGYAFSL